MSGLEQEFPGKVTAHNVDATTPESEAEVKKLGFGRHGLVIRASNGEPVFQQADHTVDIAMVRAALTQLLQ